MNIQELEQKSNELDDQVRKSIRSDNDQIKAIPDGIIDFEKYLNTKFRILWILKEPYDELDGGNNPTGGGWHYREPFIERSSFSEFSGGRHTFPPMMYAIHGILNDFCKRSDMKEVDDDPSMYNELKSVAIININKLPSRTKSNESEIAEAYRLHRTILLNQIELYDPQIIIGGYTLQYFFDDLGIRKEEMKRICGSTDYYIKDSRIFVHAYHPAQTMVTQEQYCNDIIEAVRIWNDGSNNSDSNES